VEVVAGVGGGAFVLVSLALGVKLLWLARRTRQLPEFACGLALLLMGAIGYPLLAVAQQATNLPVGFRSGLLVAQMICHVVANAAFCTFTRTVFRPSAKWASALSAAVVVAVTAEAAIQVATPGLAAFVTTGEGIWRYHGGVAIVPLLWAATESLRYGGQLARRERIGLADPVIVDRFRLWSVGMLFAASVTAVSVTLELRGTTMVNVPEGGLAIGVLGTLSALSMWFAFLPPAAYTRWVANRGSRGASFMEP
jgi:hypothetical protein